MHYAIDSVLEVKVIIMIFRLLIIHNLDRMSFTNRRVLHTTTWNYFTSRLFSRSPEVVKEAIMTDINGFVQEFWKKSRVKWWSS